MPAAPFTIVLLLLSLLLSAPLPSGSAHAVTPEEMLADPALEKRARDLSKNLRCLVCQNQSIDDSDADLARDLRLEVRRRLTDGETDAAILAAIRETYGDYVLLNPPVSPATLILWTAPLAIIAGGVLLLIATRRRRGDGEADGSAADTMDTVSYAQSDDDSGQTMPDPSATPDMARPPLPTKLALALLSLAVGCSLLIYLALGRADLPDRPLADRTAEIAAIANSAEQDNAERLAGFEDARAAVEAAPDEVGNWLKLAIASANAGRTETEIAALRQAMMLTDDDPAIASMLAEALSRAADGQVTIPARELVAGALARNPLEPRALFLSGLAAYQDGDFADAIETWQLLQSVSALDAPWIPLLADNIADAAAAGGIDLPAPGPDAADIAAAAEMSADDRDAMIAGMVEGLAARLAENPNDSAGWQRLARAYEVMGRPEDAQDAHVRAADLLVENPDAQLQALQAIVVGNAEERLRVAAERLLARLVMQLPNRPETLYLQGHFAASYGDAQAARQFWETLLARIPEDAPIAGQLRAAIDAL